MWTTESRARYDRSGLRYESDLTDEEWAEIAPLIPPAKPGGNKRTVNLREVVNGLMYILSTGCQWRAIPKDLAARSTIYDYFDRWSWDRTLDRIHHTLYVKCRERASREASPTAAIIDAQSVKGAEKGGAHVDPHGYDAGKKVKGKKRHVLVDTQGLMLHAIVTAADIQDRDGGAMLLATLFGLHPFLLKLYADGGYQGPEFRAAVRAALASVEVEIVNAAHKRHVMSQTRLSAPLCRSLALAPRRRRSLSTRFRAIHPLGARRYPSDPAGTLLPLPRPPPHAGIRVASPRCPASNQSAATLKSP